MKSIIFSWGEKMKFDIIDKSNWERRECFDHFMNVANCSYSITVNIQHHLCQTFL